MAAPSSATLPAGMNEEELVNNQKQELPHLPGEGTSSVMISSPPGAAERKKRKHPGNPSPDAEIVAVSPKTLMATNRFLCEVCKKGFQREQNLQLHRRGHNLPSNLKKKISHEIRKKAYICPEIGCVHNHPSRALGDITGIKKHFFRKHGEKKFSCTKCNKKYAIHSDWKAHNKICGTKEYKCECGTTFSRRDNFISHCSICDALAQEVARHTINNSPYSKAASILAYASNAGSVSLGSAAGSLISAGNHQQQPSLSGLGASRPNPFTTLLSRQSVGSSFEPIQPPNMTLHPFPEQKLCFSGVSDFSGDQGFRCNISPSNRFNLGFNAPADLNNSFSGFLMNAEASAYNILNSTPYNPPLSAAALLQKATLKGENSNNADLMKSMGSSLPGGMKFTSYGGALGDGMSGGARGGGSSFQGMYNNFNVDGGSYGSTRGYGSGMKYFGDQMNASSGGINADGMLVGEVYNNIVVEPQMNAQSEYCDKLTRDFLGMGNGMNNLSGGGMLDDHSGDGMATNSPDSKATTSAEVRPFVPGHCPGF